MKKQIYFTEEIWERLTQEAEKLSISRSSYIRMILLKFWEKGE